MKLIEVDWRNNSELWWDVARTEAGNCPSACQDILGRAERVIVVDEDAGAFELWAEKIPGWADGPAYARHPVTITDVEDDEDTDVIQGQSLLTG
jgi:hypothetical protein